MRHFRKLTACCHINNKDQLNALALTVCGDWGDLFRHPVRLISGGPTIGYALHGNSHVVQIRTLRETFEEEGFEIIFTGQPSENQILAFHESLYAPEAHTLKQVLEAWGFEQVE